MTSLDENSLSELRKFKKALMEDVMKVENRIALLENEEKRIFKKIDETKRRTEQILNLREENLKRPNLELSRGSEVKAKIKKNYISKEISRRKKAKAEQKRILEKRIVARETKAMSEKLKQDKLQRELSRQRLVSERKREIKEQELRARSVAAMRRKMLLSEAKQKYASKIEEEEKKKREVCCCRKREVWEDEKGIGEIFRLSLVQVLYHYYCPVQLPVMLGSLA